MAALITPEKRAKMQAEAKKARLALDNLDEKLVDAAQGNIKLATASFLRAAGAASLAIVHEAAG